MHVLRYEDPSDPSRSRSRINQFVRAALELVRRPPRLLACRVDPTLPVMRDAGLLAIIRRTAALLVAVALAGALPRELCAEHDGAVIAVATGAPSRALTMTGARREPSTPAPSVDLRRVAGALDPELMQHAPLPSEFLPGMKNPCWMAGDEAGSPTS